MRDTNDVEDGRWEFYDSWAAFPLSKTHETEPNVIGEFGVGFCTPDGGTAGEFAIRFFLLDGVAARLEAFGDSWKVLAESGLVDALAALDGQPQGPDEVRALLLGLGYEDKTARLRGVRPAYCPTCRGKGVLDDVAPSDLRDPEVRP